jgi:hypothetical protein
VEAGGVVGTNDIDGAVANCASNDHDGHPGPHFEGL